MRIRQLDIASKTISEMRGTQGLWSPRWSPDGSLILAVTTDNEAIKVLHWPGTLWKELVRLPNVDNVTWSVDSKQIFFTGEDQNRHFGVYRFDLASANLEMVVNLDGFEYAPDPWFGVDNTGTPLAFGDSLASEVFRLKCDFPR